MCFLFLSFLKTLKFKKIAQVLVSPCCYYKTNNDTMNLRCAISNWDKWWGNVKYDSVQSKHTVWWPNWWRSLGRMDTAWVRLNAWSSTMCWSIATQWCNDWCWMLALLCIVNTLGFNNSLFTKDEIRLLYHSKCFSVSARTSFATNSKKHRAYYRGNSIFAKH